MSTSAVILAAGEGKRMKSALPKVLHPVAGRPMVQHVVDAVKGAGIDHVVMVVGVGAQQVRETVNGVEFVHQEQQLGTGHAVMTATESIKNSDWVVVIPGDAPLITSEIIQPLMTPQDEAVAAMILTAFPDNPTGYGRIVRDEDGTFSRIVEEVDATGDQKLIREVNTGIIAFRVTPLLTSLNRIRQDNAQNEYYLVDVLPLLLQDGYKIETVANSDPDLAEVIGVNDRVELARAEQLFRRRVLRQLMLSGVTIVDPSTTYIDADVQIGRDTVIEPLTVIKSGTIIGEGCRLGPGAQIYDSRLGDGCVVANSVLESCRLGNNVTVGPFNHLRPGTDLADGVKIGNFAELKNTFVNTGSKVPHHSYLGDAVIGRNVNIGAGVVTVNYDGERKHQTVIADGAFIGCNVNLVAPIQIGDCGYIAAGSTIVEDVPGSALAIARNRQTNKIGWVERRRAKMKNDPS